MLGKGHLRAPGGCGIVFNTVENVQLVSFLVVVVSVDYFRSAVVTVFFRPRVVYVFGYVWKITRDSCFLPSVLARK